jgi:hypothetical protein
MAQLIGEIGNGNVPLDQTSSAHRSIFEAIVASAEDARCAMIPIFSIFFLTSRRVAVRLPAALFSRSRGPQPTRHLRPTRLRRLLQLQSGIEISGELCGVENATSFISWVAMCILSFSMTSSRSSVADVSFWPSSTGITSRACIG